MSDILVLGAPAGEVGTGGGPRRPGTAADDNRYELLSNWFGGARAAGVSWTQVLEAAAGLLQEFEPDLKVLGFYTRAVTQVHQLDGLSAALNAWAHQMTEDRWDKTRPASARGKVTQLVAAIDWAKAFVDSLNTSDSTVDGAAVRRVQTAAEQLEQAAAARLSGAPVEIISLRNLLAELATRNPIEAPPTARSGMTGAQGQEPADPSRSAASDDRATETTAPAGTAAEPAPPTRRADELNGQPQPEPGAAGGQGGSATQEVVAADPSAERPETKDFALRFSEFKREALKILEEARRADPAAEWTYRAARDIAWAQVQVQAGEKGRLTLPAPREVKKLLSQLTSAEQERRWGDLLLQAEGAWRQGVLWLDPQRYAALALRGLGHLEAAAAVETAVGALVARIPALPALSFNQGMPLASDETRAWLSGLGRPGLAAKAALPTSDAETDRTEGRRSAFLASLEVGRGLLEARAWAPAAHLFEALLAETLTRQLDTWEPALARATRRGLLRALLAGGTVSSCGDQTRVGELIRSAVASGDHQLLTDASTRW